MAEWRKSTWGDEITLEYGKALRDYSKVSGLIRVFGANGPIGWTDTPLAPGPGVILGRKGAYRGVQYSLAPFFVIDTAYYCVPKTDLDMRWLYYAVIHHQLGQIDDGSPIPSTTRAAVYPRELAVPLLGEQRAIASILGALDDKIELNRRTAQALEKLARAIFCAWFVDFEPVKAKAEGRTGFPFVPQSVFDALPVSFVDTDIGPVPDGWAVKPFSQICRLVSGGTPKRSELSYWGGGIPWYSVRDAPSDGNVWVTGTTESISEAGLASGAAKLLPKGGTIISARGTVGKIAMVGMPMAFNQSCYGLLPVVEQAFCYLYQLVQSAVSELQQRTHGSVFDTITRATFDTLMVVSPDEKVVSGFSEAVGTYFELMLALKKESSRLAEMRDYLLPRLLSGAIRVEAGCV